MKVLVTYASKHGSTQGIAEAIGRGLVERGFDTDVRQVEEVGDLEPYDAVVAGSAVYFGAWRKEALAFLDRHGDALRRVPVWLFSSGPVTPPGAPVDQKDVGLLAKTKDRLDAVGARDHRLFRGAADPAKLSFIERMPLKMAKMPMGDYREWDDIAHWADGIADRMAADRAAR